MQRSVVHALVPAPRSLAFERRYKTVRRALIAPQKISSKLLLDKPEEIVSNSVLFSVRKRLVQEETQFFADTIVQGCSLRVTFFNNCLFLLLPACLFFYFIDFSKFDTGIFRKALGNFNNFNVTLL